MEYKQLGKTEDKLPVIGMGSWKLGVNEAEEVAALKHGLKLGTHFIDTAEIYGTEPIVAKAISGEDVFIATKVWPVHFKYEEVIKACDESMSKLGIKTIDLYQLHWPNYRVPIEETMRAMEKLKEDGKIRHIGVSNFPVEDLKKAQDALKNAEIVSNQIEYSIIMREPENGMLKYCKENGITIIAYSPFGHGALFDAKNEMLLHVMEDIGKKHGKTKVQVALNWLVSKEQVVTIPKASTIAHVEENIKAGEFKLSDEDIELLDKESMEFQKKPASIGFWERNKDNYGPVA